MLLEGEFAGGRVVIVEFPFVSEMKAWQATPEYLEAAKIRSAATHTLDDPRQFIRAAYHLRVDIAAIPADSRMHTVPVPLVEEQRFRIQ